MSTDVFWTVFPFWIKAFALTLAVEVPIFWYVGTKDIHTKNRLPWWRLVLAGAAGTCTTHPLFWFVWPLWISDYTLYMLSGEILVAFLEVFIFMAVAYPIRFSYALAASLIANAASWGIGALIGVFTN